MCTVTYIPLENGDFILTQNRDEDVKRPIATPPIDRTINGTKHLFPIDPQGKGTWIGISNTGRVASLLNGGTEPYKHQPPYRQSRGKVILDYINNPDMLDYCVSVDNNEQVFWGGIFTFHEMYGSGAYADLNIKKRNGYKQYKYWI